MTQRSSPKDATLRPCKVKVVQMAKGHLPSRMMDLSPRERRNIADALALCEITPLSPGLIDTVFALLSEGAPLNMRFESRSEIPGLWNWTIKLDSRCLVDIAWGSWTYGFPMKVEIMGLLLPSEAEDDQVLAVSMSTFLRRYRAYRDHPTLFLPMWKLTKTHMRE